jgi:hypothetical protein
MMFGEVMGGAEGSAEFLNVFAGFLNGVWLCWLGR